MSRFRAYIQMSHVRVHVRHARGLAVRARGYRTALDTELENGAGPSDGGGGERCLFNHRGRGEAHWAFRARRSGGYGIYRTITPRAVGAR